MLYIIFLPSYLSRSYIKGFLGHLASMVLPCLLHTVLYLSLTSKVIIREAMTGPVPTFSCPPKNRQSSRLLYGQCLLWPNGRPSQLLLSSCIVWEARTTSSSPFCGNYVPLLYHFQDVTSYLSSIANFSYAHVCTPNRRWGWPRWNFIKISVKSNTRVTELSRGVGCVITFDVLTEHRIVTERQTPRHQLLAYIQR